MRVDVVARSILVAILPLPGALGCGSALPPPPGDGGSDAAPPCGNGVRDPGETCDPAIPFGAQGACPTSCDDGVACTVDGPTGSTSTCDVVCLHAAITTCLNADGCCPPAVGCSSSNDSDCMGICGNGVLEPPGESCDSAIASGNPGACPMSCPSDGDPCTNDLFTGSSALCSALCTHVPITACIGGDACCPESCNANDDGECTPSCGNGVVEDGELCDGDCPTSCDDGDACTTDMLTGTGCSRACTHDDIPICGPGALDDVLRMNHLQMKGTHNSFHLRTWPLGSSEWDYAHAPLDVQFESQGVRAIELDVFWDWVENRFEVYHVYLVDDATTCLDFQDCLRTILAWSNEHPGHHPLFVQIEPKGDVATDVSHMPNMEQAILEVIPFNQIVTPDFVRGSATTLRGAVTTTGWPTLGETRGKILFFLDCERDLCVEYANGGASLDGRLIFAASQASDTWAAVMVINTPGMAVTTAAQAGYIVRTRAFSVSDAQADDYSSVAVALASGGHIISTDVPAAVPEYEQHMVIPGGTPSRCNPVTAPAECTSLLIEDPSALAP